MRHLQGHKKDVRTVAFLPDGRLVSGGSDNSVRVWNPVSGEGIATIKARAPVYALAVRPTDAVIAYAGRYRARADSNFVYLCDATGKAIGQREIRRQVMVWGHDPMTGEFGQRLQWVPRSVWSVAFSSDGMWLVAACRVPGGANIPNGGGGHGWRDGARPLDAPLPAADAYALAFAGTGQSLAVSRENAVEFFPAPDAACVTRYPLTAYWAPAIAFVPGADLAVVGSNSFLYFLCPGQQTEPTRLKTGISHVSAVAVSPNGSVVLVGGRSGSIEVYDVVTRARVKTYDFRIGGLHAIAFAPDGLTFAAAGDDGLLVCDTDTSA